MVSDGYILVVGSGSTIERVKKMELNGLCNIAMKIEKYKKSGKIGVNQANELLQDIRLLNRYLTAIHYRPQTCWHEVIKTPSLFPELSEVQQTIFLAIKAAKDGEEDIACKQVIKEIYGDIE